MTTAVAALWVRDYFRGFALRQLRISCGLVMFCYLLSHFTNHALGNISYAALKEGLTVHMAIWRYPPVAVLLYSAALVHASLGLWALYERRHFHWKAPEITQLVLGLSIPALMLQHLVGLRLPALVWDVNRYYAHAFNNYIQLRPDQFVMTITGLIFVWTHACIGLFFWLRMRQVFKKLAPFLLAGAVMLPTLALMGISHAGSEYMERQKSSAWRTGELTQPASPERRQQVDALKEYALMGYLAIVLLVFAARAARDLRERRRGTIRLSYPGGRHVTVPRGYSVLEASFRHRVPHASVCGGRARCSICRVRIIGDLGGLPQPSRRESYVLHRVGAGDNVRLACQLRPTGNLSIVPLVPADDRALEYFLNLETVTGQQRAVCVLFADLRGFTRFSERKLPYDVVFFLNRYFDSMGRAIEQCKGIPNQFTGDGIMALFGVESGAAQGCRDATEAAKAMVRALDELGTEFADQLDEPLRMGIGIHVGTAVVGNMGRGVAMYLTAVGDTVHVASRLQDLTKQYKCQLIISELTARQAGIEVSAYPAYEVTVRNRNDPIPIRTIQEVASIVAKGAV
jgi:adenylate cyclase